MVADDLALYFTRCHDIAYVMSCCLVGAKQLAKPKLTDCQIDHGEQTSVQFYAKYEKFL